MHACLHDVNPVLMATVPEHALLVRRPTTVACTHARRKVELRSIKSHFLHTLPHAAQAR